MPWQSVDKTIGALTRGDSQHSALPLPSGRVCPRWGKWRAKLLLGRYDGTSGRVPNAAICDVLRGASITPLCRSTFRPSRAQFRLRSLSAPLSKVSGFRQESCIKTSYHRSYANLAVATPTRPSDEFPFAIPGRPYQDVSQYGYTRCESCCDRPLPASEDRRETPWFHASPNEACPRA